MFGFSKLDVMFGRATPDAVRLPYADIVKPGVKFVQSAIRKIDPQTRRVQTDAGEFEADVLVVERSGELIGPSTELAAEKAQFGSSRAMRWFGREWSAVPA